MSHPIWATVLIVHEHPRPLEVLRALLEEAGCRTMTATDSRQGFEQALRDRPDVIVSAFSMPHMTGVELCRAIRRTPTLYGTPVLLVSSVLTNPYSAEAGFMAGAADFLPMPYVPSQLARKVRHLADARRG
jgi:two-component system phosphate regulon response regulator PhoB